MTDVLDAAFTSTTAPDGAAGTWSRSHTHRCLALGGSRAFAQLLAMAWFVAAARILTDAQYGVVATGMAFFAVFAGVGDVGTTRTLVRHVAAEPRMVWTTYRAAVGVRVAVAVRMAPPRQQVIQRLRAIADGKELGDVSTLRDPSVVEELQAQVAGPA